MKPSAKIVAFIKDFEKCRLSAYAATVKERAKGIWTIGWGETRGVKQGDVWTQEQADTTFAARLGEFADAVDHCLDGSPATQGQFDAMLSLAYNIGIGAFAASTLLRRHKAGNYAAAQGQFSVWNKQGGEVLAGLVRRRAGEAKIYAGG